MGPRPDGRGRRSRAGPPTTSIRVNGAAAGWPRKACKPQVLYAPKSASMGPRPDGRGRGISEAVSRPARQASMGPRPDGRGRSNTPSYPLSSSWRQWGRGRMAAEGCFTLYAQSMTLASVNGAAAGWPRKAEASSGAHLKCRRQWGRGRMAAEGRSSMQNLYRTGERQWGRGRMAAEGRRSPQKTSMGQQRQWGRGRMAAEGAAGRPGAAGAALPGVNGAAAGWPRKDAGPDGQRRPCQRQWGRGRMAAEGGNRRLAASGRPGVNGAAAGWPRKVEKRSLRQVEAEWRQWGRGRMAAEGTILSNVRVRYPDASMGPRPDGRGRLLPGDVDEHGLPRQWGRGRMAAEG